VIRFFKFYFLILPPVTTVGFRLKKDEKKMKIILSDSELSALITPSDKKKPRTVAGLRIKYV